MKVLITGGFGYLGGRVAQSLSEQGYDVVLGTREDKTPPNWLRKAEVAKIDWNNKDTLNSICKGVDIVIHTAGVNTQECTLDPVGAIEFNGISTTRLVQASVNSGVNKFIYLSTAHVYASSLSGEINEESCLKNKNPYATSHVIGENSVLYYSSIVDNFTGIVLRLSNGIGPPTHKDVNCWMLAVNNFCRQVIENGIIVVKSDRKVERDFIPISLLCDSIYAIINNSETNSGVINISSTNAVSLDDVTNIIRGQANSLLGFIPEVIFRNDDEFSSKKFTISNKKLKSLLTVETDLDDEIKQLLLKCKKWYG